MATEGQTERSHEEQAELWSCTTVQFALRVGQPEPPKVLFDASRSQPGLAAYYYPTDELILHPNLAVERPDLYCYEGLILHELGHRASPAPLRARRWIRLLLPAAVVFGLPGYIDLAAPNLSAIVLLAMMAAIAAGAIAVWILSWLAEFAADDYTCDHGGIARAAAMLELIDNHRGKWSHPPTRMRLHRQLRRAGLLPGRR